ncbi:MAG: glycosyltransferase family 4 protein [Acidobacteria bacterium]|nr:glycosyltransferase family 4 protein [Acidobacteriota bacterium]
MTIVTPVPYLRRQEKFGGGDTSGSLAAHEDLLLWSLRSGIAREAWLLSGKLGMPTSGPALEMTAAIRELEPDLAARISPRAAHWFAREGGCEREGVIALGKAMDFAELAHLRSCAARPFPISCLVHAVLFPSLLSSLLSALVHACEADAFIATSRAAAAAMESLLRQTRDTLLRACPRLLESDVRIPRVSLIPLGIDDGWAAVPRDEARDRLSLPRDATILLWVGRLTEHYKADLDPLLNAFQALRADHPRLWLVLAGNTIQAGSRGLPAGMAANQENVRVLANFRRNVKPAIYGCADIFVSPVDNVQESFGLAILEAMASGLPVVASDWSGYRDLVVPGETGFLVPTILDDSAWSEFEVLASFAVAPLPEHFLAQNTAVDVAQLTSALRILLDNHDIRERHGRSGCARVHSHFRWSEVIRQYGRLWREQAETCGWGEFRSAPPVSFRRAFAHYPTESIDSSLRLMETTNESLEQYRRQSPSDREGLKILECCLNNRMSLHTLGGSSDHRRRRAAFRLMKKGFLRVALRARCAAEAAG